MQVALKLESCFGPRKELQHYMWFLLTPFHLKSVRDHIL